MAKSPPTNSPIDHTLIAIQLRCRAHNAYEADLFFSTDDDLFVREEVLTWVDS